MENKLNSLNHAVNVDNHLTERLIPFLSKEENTVMSPFGIKAVLSMIAEGASEESLNEILAVLGVENLDGVRKSIFAMQEGGCKAFSSNNSLNLKSGRENLHLIDDYSRIMKEDYKSEIIEEASNGLASLILLNKASFAAKWAMHWSLIKVVKIALIMQI